MNLSFHAFGGHLGLSFACCGRGAASRVVGVGIPTVSNIARRLMGTNGVRGSNVRVTLGAAPVGAGS